MTDDIAVRPDLNDIADTIRHLVLLARWFNKNNVEAWSDLWYKNGQETLSSSLHSIEDHEFIEAVEDVYKKGRDTAVSMSDDLEIINDFDRCPKLKNYIQHIRERRDEWLKEDGPLLDRCERVIKENPNYKVNYWAIQRMIQLHRDQLNRLDNLEADFQRIEASKRYTTENGIRQSLSAPGVEASVVQKWSLSWWALICAIAAVPIALIALYFQYQGNGENTLIVTGNSAINSRGQIGGQVAQTINNYAGSPAKRSDLDGKSRKKIREEVNDYIRRGVEFEGGYRMGHFQVESDFIKKHYAWENECYAYLEKTFDKSYADRFRRPDFPQLNDDYYKKHDGSSMGGDKFNFIRQQLTFLREVIAKNDREQ